MMTLQPVRRYKYKFHPVKPDWRHFSDCQDISPKKTHYPVVNKSAASYNVSITSFCLSKAFRKLDILNEDVFVIFV